MLRFLFLPYFLFTCLGAAAQDFRIAPLHCEHRVNPVGIDMPKPSFGWQIDAESRGFIQSAYQIQVGADSSQLIKNIAGEWSTGKILSSQSQLILYAGKKLQPAKKYFWRVRTWDKNGRVSSWSVV